MKKKPEQTKSPPILLDILQNKKNAQRVKEFKKFQKECFSAKNTLFETLCITLLTLLQWFTKELPSTVFRLCLG
jgi:hypothetical protein